MLMLTDSIDAFRDAPDRYTARKLLEAMPHVALQTVAMWHGIVESRYYATDRTWMINSLIQERFGPVRTEAMDMLVSADILTSAELHEFDGGEMVIHLRRFGYGDYDNSSASDRSNVRSLVRDWPNFLSTYNGAFYFEGIALYMDEFTDANNEEDALALAETLVGLVNDYPVYNESDLSDLESEMAQEAWDNGTCFDLIREIEERFGVELAAYTLDTDGALYSLFIETYSDIFQDYGYAETANSWVWPHDDTPDFLDAMFNGIARIIRDDVSPIAAGQLALAV